MNYFKGLAVKCYWLVFLIFIPPAISFKASAQTQAQFNPSKITFSSPEEGRKLAISLHHALLEVDYAKGYLIADIDADDKQKIKHYGFETVTATEWLKRYQQHQNQIKQLQVKQRQIHQLQTHQLQTKTAQQKTTGINGFSCYATVEETFEQAALLAQSNPTLAEWIDIGDSWQKINQASGYDLMVLKITNQTINADKPKLFINTGLHAREYAPAALGLDFAKLLLQDYQSNADVHWLVDQHEIHLLLQTNPDGRKVAEGGILQRKNMNSNHCSQDAIGVDLNRNFAFTWAITTNGSSADSCSQVFRGNSAESEPETQALSNYVRSIFDDNRGELDQDAAPDSTTGIHLDIHSFSELVLWPNGHTEQPTANDQAFIALGNKFAWFNDYSPQQSIGLYPTDGTSDDVSYGELGVAAFTFELGNSFFEPCTNYQNQIKPDNLKALIYAAKAAAAPYQLAFGPEITQISFNQQTSMITLEPNQTIELQVTASAEQTKLPISDKRVTRIIYSVDLPLTDPNATLVELTNDGDPSSGIETMSAQIQTNGLTEGEHIVYFQAFDNDKAGVVSAQFFHIKTDNNQAPQAAFSYQCSDLTCQFDASSSQDADGSITAYQWVLSVSGSSESITLSGVEVSHTFAQSGAVNAQLTVVDNLGAQSEFEQVFSVDITETEEPESETAASSSGGGSLIWLGLFLIFILSVRQGFSQWAASHKAGLNLNQASTIND